MSRIATLAMFLAWLLYGAMPAIGMPGMAMAAQNPTAFSDSGDHGAGTAHMAGMSQAAHDLQQTCPHGGKACAAPFCAACLTLVPELAFGDELPAPHGSPAPATQQAFVSPAPAPLTPPPRA